jgi:peptide/nickel transport system substrate-binding protein
MVMSLIMNFDVAKEASPIFDEAQVPALESFMSTFRGMRITSLDPFTIEYYSDDWSLDAENALTTLRAAWPNYGYGEAPWHAIAIGVAADAAGQAAFSADKATAGEVEQISYIAGPTLEMLGGQLADATAASTIPYSATLGTYVTAEEAATRYANLQSWFTEKGHYWVGTGPFYLEQAFPVEGTVLLRRNEAFADPADKWSRFSAPAIAEVAIDGAGRVTPGAEATFDVLVTYNDAPYAMADVEEVKYLVFDADGNLATQGSAEPVEDGTWRVTLAADATTGLGAGSSRLEAIVVSKLVALPSLATMEFVVAP